MPGKHSRNKGARFEREVVNFLRNCGFKAERIPLSGAMGSFKGDVQAEIGGHSMRIECKSLANGFRFLYESLGENDALMIRADRKEILVVLPLGSWIADYIKDESKIKWPT